MYIPRFDLVLHHLNLSQQKYEEASSVTIPAALLRFLLQLVLLETDFNEEGYLKENRDISDAVNSGHIESPRLHYIGTGYFEGRRGATPKVDEAWYLKNFPDVAVAVRAGVVASARDHFEAVGAAEFRAPSADYEMDAVEWAKAFGKSAPGGDRDR